MKVFWNGRFLTRRITGVQRYAIEMLRAVDAILAERGVSREKASGGTVSLGGADSLGHTESLGHAESFEILAPEGAEDPGFRAIGFRHVGRGYGRGQFWEQVALPFHARRGILASLANAAPFIHPRSIVTIHDAAVFAVPEAYSRAFVAWNRFLSRGLGKRARRIATDSNFSRCELMARAGIPASKIAVIHPGADHLASVVADTSILDRLGVAGEPFILAVGSRNPAKNLAGLASALSRLGEAAPTCVIVGGADPRIFARGGTCPANGEGTRDARLRPGATQPASTARIIDAGYLDDASLRALYERAAGLVFPSFYEGFGLPPLEAMSCGCPTIVSRAASLGEVCGDAARYVDPYDPADIARTVRDIVGDPALRRVLRARGYERARRFLWRDAARAFLDELEALAAGTRSVPRSTAP